MPKPHFNEGRVHSKETCEIYRQAALLREERKGRRVSVRGIIYPNIARAAKAINIDPAWLGKCIKDSKKPEYFYVIPAYQSIIEKISDE